MRSKVGEAPPLVKRRPSMTKRSGRTATSGKRAAKSSRSSQWVVAARPSRRPARASSQLPASTPRSEEHTSELQSLMRISYAVFCLKKKKQEHPTNTHQQHDTQ